MAISVGAFWRARTILARCEVLPVSTPDARQILFTVKVRGSENRWCSVSYDTERRLWGCDANDGTWGCVFHKPCKEVFCSHTKSVQLYLESRGIDIL